MKAFVQLTTLLSAGADWSQQVNAIGEFLAGASEKDAMWAASYLGREHPRSVISVSRWKDAVCDRTGVAGWMIEECAQAAGNVCEAMALLLDTEDVLSREGSELSVAEVFESVLPAIGSGGATGRSALIRAWEKLSAAECIFFHKLITGRGRMNPDESTVIEAIAEWVEIPVSVVAYRWPSFEAGDLEAWRKLLAPQSENDSAGVPYSSRPETVIREVPEEAGEVADWFIARKWGVAGMQIVKRRGVATIWSAQGILENDVYPHWVSVAESLPDGTVLLVEAVIRPESTGRFEHPVRCRVTDLLEVGGEDICDLQWSERRLRLERLWNDWDRSVSSDHLSQGDFFAVDQAETGTADTLEMESGISISSWERVKHLVDRSGSSSARGVTLVRRSSIYADGVLWWKPEPHRCICGLIGIKRGRTTELGDLILGAWHENEIVPVVMLGFQGDDQEVEELGRFVDENTLRRRGPIVDLPPEYVFEIEFDELAATDRNRARVSLLGARVVGLCRNLDKLHVTTVSDLLDLNAGHS